MEKQDMLQELLNLSNSSMAMFDIIESSGLDAPLEDIGNIMKLKDLFDASTKIIDYYQQRNIIRMMNLGVSPTSILKMGDPE